MYRQFLRAAGIGSDAVTRLGDAGESEVERLQVALQGELTQDHYMGILCHKRPTASRIERGYSVGRGWENKLQRWVGAGLVDAATADRIRAFEAEGTGERKLRWPAVFAWAFGGTMVGAGILLFVAAHWDDLSPGGRFALVLAQVAAFHVLGGVLASRAEILAKVLHGVGTAALGAGIFLAGQIFNLQEHWPGGVMLWALGAGFAWWLLGRDWLQAGWLAVLVPSWLAGEWSVATEYQRGADRVLAHGLLLLAITYFAALTTREATPVRRVLMWIGGLALLPCTLFLILQAREPTLWGMYDTDISGGLEFGGWFLAYAVPLGLAVLLRRRQAWPMLVAAGWVVLLGLTGLGREQMTLLQYLWYELSVYLWCGVGSALLVAWGLMEERRERINMGVACFALTVLTFYFSYAMDKLARSTSLIGLGLLFLVGGWYLERMRRKLVARVAEAHP